MRREGYKNALPGGVGVVLLAGCRGWWAVGEKKVEDVSF